MQASFNKKPLNQSKLEGKGVRHLIFILIILAALLSSYGCTLLVGAGAVAGAREAMQAKERAKAKKQTPESVMQIRQKQIRVYDAKYDIVFKATMDTLQDLGFVISETDKETGLIVAKMDVDTSVSQWSLFLGAVARYRHEATANVEPWGKGKTRVRINLVEKAINKSDKVISSRIIDDSEQYRRFFFKLDKAIFIRKKKL